MNAVSLFMDVEDPINLLADDAALDFPRLFDEASVIGSFCLTGEKCRSLYARGRFDVAQAYRDHSLGLHTDTHSLHPTTMELLADMKWDAGCVAAFGAEKRGFDAFETFFGRAPAFWGGAGNTWSPEITDALKRLGIPAYSYALTQVPNHAVHSFNGVIALPQALSIPETDWADDNRAASAIHRVIGEIHSTTRPWTGIFVGHPTKFRYQDWWDTPYYSGRTPSSPEFGIPVSEESYLRAKSNLRRFLMAIRTECRVIGVEEALKMDWNFRELSPSEMGFFQKETAKQLRSVIGWPIHRPGLHADNIIAKTLALTSTVRIAENSA